MYVVVYEESGDTIREDTLYLRREVHGRLLSRSKHAISSRYPHMLSRVESIRMDTSPFSRYSSYIANAQVQAE